MLTFVPPGNVRPQISAPSGGTNLSSGKPIPGCSLIASFIVACLLIQQQLYQTGHIALMERRLTGKEA